MFCAAVLVAAPAVAQTDIEEEATADESASSAQSAPTQSLEKINVTSTTASGVAKDVASAPASVSVITAEDLEGKSYRDITDALQAVPGVYVDEGAAGKGGSQQISIRGWDPKYTKILVDGIPQSSQQAYYNGYGSGSEFGWLPPIAAIERIEIIRGPMSSLYGSDAMGGVINIITKPVPDAWNGTLTLDKIIQEDDRSGDSDQVNYYLSGPLVSDKLALSFYGERFDRDEDRVQDGYQDYTRESNAARLNWTPNGANQIALEMGYSTQDSVGSQDASGSDIELERVRRHQSLTHDIDWGGGVRTKSYVQHAKMENETQNATYERSMANTSTVIPFSNNVLTVGAHYRVQETENPDRALGKPNLERWDVALFAEDEWYVTDPFALITGARWVKDENYGSKFVPRVYGVYSYSPQLTFKGGVSAGYRTPDLKEGDSAWLEGGGGPSRPGGRDIGNSDLEPEESLTYEAAVHWTGYDGIDASLTVYHTDYDNKIEKPVICPALPDNSYHCEYQGEFYQVLYQYMNVDKAEMQGVEVTFAYAIAPNLRIDSSYTYTRTEQLSGDNKGDPLNNQPEHRANLGINWRATPATRVWSRVRYRGRTEFFGRGGPDDGESPGYTVVDAGTKYDVTGHVSLYGGIYNVFDKDLTTQQYGRVIDGRRFNAGVTFTF
ncbi:outer membrane receptor [Salinisphaera sp. PC39]